HRAEKLIPEGSDPSVLPAVTSRLQPGHNPWVWSPQGPEVPDPGFREGAAERLRRLTAPVAKGVDGADRGGRDRRGAGDRRLGGRGLGFQAAAAVADGPAGADRG